MSSTQTPAVVACADCAKRDEVLDAILYDLLCLQQNLFNKEEEEAKELIENLIYYVNSKK